MAKKETGFNNFKMKGFSVKGFTNADEIRRYSKARGIKRFAVKPEDDGSLTFRY